MQHAAFDQPGEPSVLYLAESPVPDIKDDQVLIQVKAIGVNRPDILQRQGAYPPPADASPILGLEVAGIIAEAGAQASWFQPGQRVVALCNGGGYAE